jgi:uncharacterized membrane protein
MTIRNPIEWSLDQLRTTGRAVGAASQTVYHKEEDVHALLPAVHRITYADLREAIARGLDDFGAYRADVIFISIIYPVVGLVLARVASGYDVLPLLFPLASGFALVGPFAALGLYEMSRRHEQGDKVSWADAFGVFRSPRIAAILTLGLVLMVIFFLWLLAAQLIYDATMGPKPPASVTGFVHDVFYTRAGWAMIGVGIGVGFLFAVLALSISVVSFPLLLDRDVGVDTALYTSIRAVITNPGPMAVWGLIVTGGLVAGSIPVFVGLVIVMPVLGHATWHLYRKVVH